jgi:DNA-binding CsgD family transcriptional regulator
MRRLSRIVLARVSLPQRQVARLSGQGVSNRQIGETIGMSPRTAESHLHHGYRLRGANERFDLASQRNR